VPAPKSKEQIVNVSRTRSLVVTLVAVAGLAACGQGADSDADTNAPADDTSSATVELTADASSAGKCAMPNAETLAGFDTAFEGTVTSLDDGTATLAVDQWYAGGDGASTVTVATPNKALEDLLLAVDFKADKTYLVSATGGRVTLCGFTGEKTTDLEVLYASAFES
jgi:hypothetical protein